MHEDYIITIAKDRGATLTIFPIPRTYAESAEATLKILQNIPISTLEFDGEGTRVRGLFLLDQVTLSNEDLWHLNDKYADFPYDGLVVMRTTETPLSDKEALGRYLVGEEVKYLSDMPVFGYLVYDGLWTGCSANITAYAATDIKAAREVLDLAREDAHDHGE